MRSVYGSRPNQEIEVCLETLICNGLQTTTSTTFHSGPSHSFRCLCYLRRSSRNPQGQSDHDRLIVVPEISRLQNSLKHLKETQEVLEAALAETTEPPDADITQAFEENQVVMYVQACLS